MPSRAQPGRAAPDCATDRGVFERCPTLSSRVRASACSHPDTSRIYDVFRGRARSSRRRGRAAHGTPRGVESRADAIIILERPRLSGGAAGARSHLRPEVPRSAGGASERKRTATCHVLGARTTGTERTCSRLAIMVNTAAVAMVQEGRRSRAKPSAGKDPRHGESFTSARHHWTCRHADRCNVAGWCDGRRPGGRAGEAVAFFVGCAQARKVLSREESRQKGKRRKTDAGLQKSSFPRPVGRSPRPR